MNEAVMEFDLKDAERIGKFERLRLSWAIAWPCIMFDLIYLLTCRLLRLSADQLSIVVQVVGIFQFFFYSTWVIRRTVRMDFPGFHLAVMRRKTEEETRKMSYKESLSVAWLICWRAAVFSLPLYVVLFAIHRHPPTSDNVLDSISDSILELLIFYFWIVQAAVRKEYSRFVLKVERKKDGIGYKPCE